MRNIAVAAALPVFALPLLADSNARVNTGSPPCGGCAPYEVVSVEPRLPVFVAARSLAASPVLVGKTYRYRGPGRLCPRGVPRPRLVAPARRPSVVLRSPYGRSRLSPYCYSFKPPKRHRR